MEGFEDYLMQFFRVLLVIVAIGLFITSGILYEKNKELKAELNKCQIELEVYKELKE